MAEPTHFSLPQSCAWGTYEGSCVLMGLPTGYFSAEGGMEALVSSLSIFTSDTSFITTRPFNLPVSQTLHVQTSKVSYSRKQTLSRRNRLRQY